MSKFVHLHIHSEFSLLDGANRIKDLPVRAKKVRYGCNSINRSWSNVWGNRFL